MAAISEELTVELYKSLRAECAGYIEKIPGLWLQKFVLIGGVIAFILTNHSNIDKLSTDYPKLLIVVAISVVPILAILVDARTLEYGLHARAISLFIEQHFDSPEVLALWERTLWTTRGPWLTVVLRSMISVLITIVPTIGIGVLSALTIGAVLNRPSLGATLAMIFGGTYVLLTVLMGIAIWRQTPVARQRGSGMRSAR